MRQHVGGVPLMAVVKADGYGHGMIPAAHAAVIAGGAQRLGVVCMEHEALALRRAGLHGPGAVPASARQARRTSLAIRDDVDLTVDAVPLLQEIVARGREKRDARPGCSSRSTRGWPGAEPRRPGWPALVAAARFLAEAAGDITITGFLVPSSLRGHTPGHPSVDAELARFTEGGRAGRGRGSPPRGPPPGEHRGDPRLPGHLVRPGPAGWREIYGLATIPGGAPDWLRPAMTLRTQLTLVQRVPGGTPASLRSPLHHPGRRAPRG